MARIQSTEPAAEEETAANEAPSESVAPAMADTDPVASEASLEESATSALGDMASGVTGGGESGGGASGGGGAALIALGSTAFNEGFCQKCHNAGGVGGDRAPDLTDTEWVQCDGTVEGIRAVIVSGVPEEKHSKAGYPFGMNGAARMNLSDATVDALAAYVHSLSQ